MKKTICFALAALACVLAGQLAQAAEISRIEPPCWWVGMKNPELQIMVYGPGIGEAHVSVDYPGVRLKETVKTENPNYLFLYLDIEEDAAPGRMDLSFETAGGTMVREYELLPRSTLPGAMGFSGSEVLYLITPDRFAN